MAETRFCLVRHGAYPLLDRALGGRADHALDAAGRAQAERLADTLADEPIAAVVSSPVWRARETAAPLAARLGLSVTPDAAFAEIDFGAWTGQSFATLAGDPAWDAWNRFRSGAATPGGETMLAAQARAVAGLQRLATLWPDATVAVVSHADIVKALLAQALGAPLDLMGRMEVTPGSISRLTLYPADARVVSVNLVP